MNTSWLAQRRTGYLALLAGIALATALATGLVDTGHSSSNAAHGETAHSHSEPAASAATAGKKISKAAFHDDMRKLWEDHVTWTRLAIVTFVDDSASFDATAARLMQNQVDIGDAIKPFYGTAAGNQLTALLQDHIGIAVELLVAAKDGNTDAFDDANARWYANADDIADFLAAANPGNWPKATMRAAMRTHLDQTLAEASHELTGAFAESVADYDEIHHHILVMADVLSSGIVKAFPKRFR
jgi:hypothetical protein